MYKNFPIGFVSEEALHLVGQSSGRSAVETHAEQKDFRLDAEVLAIYSTEINTHKWYLSEQLGRDVGFHVAAADYLANIKPIEAKPAPSGVASGLKRLAEKLGLLSLNFDGPNSLLNFERAMRGTQSLAR